MQTRHSRRNSSRRFAPSPFPVALVPFFDVGNAIQQLPLDSFFSLLPQFSFSSLSTLSIVNPLLSDADLRSLTYLLQSHNLPLYVLINGSLLASLSRRQSAARRLFLPGASGRRPAVVAAAGAVAEAGDRDDEDADG